MRKSPLKFSHAGGSSFTLDVAKTQGALQDWMEREKIDVLVASSQDMFLSEYNALCNSHRYALTGFAGSTGDALFLSRKVCIALKRQAGAILYVDGRYHLQADKECDSRWVEVVKLGLGDSQDALMKRWMEEHAAQAPVCAIDGARNTWRRWKDLEEIGSKKGFTVRVLLNNELNAVLGLPGWQVERPLLPVSERATGRTIGGVLGDLHQRLPVGADPKRACVMSCASDDAAFLLQARGFHTKESSAILAQTFVIGREIVAFLPEGIDQCAVEIPASGKDYKMVVVRKSVEDLRKALASYSVETVLFAAGGMNAALPKLAAEIWPKARVVTDFDGIEWLRARKTPEEIATIQDAFLRSSRAIARTLRWLKSSTALAAGQATSDASFVAPVTERDLADKLAVEFAAEGAVEHSFNTISAAGANGAVIHYAAASAECAFQPGMIGLLDCGAYYVEGFATDTTRAVFCPAAGKSPEAWQKKIYTVVLKGMLAVQHAEFDRELVGNQLDLYARNVCAAYGYDYLHGTGHGIGIHVHEGGHRIGKVSLGHLAENGVISLEPGIYLAGQGGVRLENCAVVRAHPTDVKRYMFQNLTFVGFDWDLIDVSLLNAREKVWLKDYEKKCVELGTQVTPCPL